MSFSPSPSARERFFSVMSDPSSYRDSRLLFLKDDLYSDQPRKRQFVYDLSSHDFIDGTDLRNIPEPPWDQPFITNGLEEPLSAEELMRLQELFPKRDVSLSVLNTHEEEKPFSFYYTFQPEKVSRAYRLAMGLATTAKARGTQIERTSSEIKYFFEEVYHDLSSSKRKTLTTNHLTLEEELRIKNRAVYTASVFRTPLPDTRGLSIAYAIRTNGPAPILTRFEGGNEAFVMNRVADVAHLTLNTLAGTPSASIFGSVITFVAGGYNFYKDMTTYK